MDRGAWRATAHGVSKNRKKKKERKRVGHNWACTHNEQLYYGNQSSKINTSHDGGTVRCWIRPSVPGDRALSPCCPGDKRVWDPFSCWGTHNTGSIIGHSKSVCIWKVLYVTVFMHPGRPLAQLLTSASHSSGEQRANEPTEASERVRNLGEGLFTRESKASPEKAADWTGERLQFYSWC